MSTTETKVRVLINKLIKEFNDDRLPTEPKATQFRVIERRGARASSFSVRFLDVGGKQLTSRYLGVFMN